MDCSHQTWAGGGPAEIVAEDVAGVLMSSGEESHSVESTGTPRQRAKGACRPLTEQRSGLWDVVIQAEASLTHVAQRYSRFSGKQTLSGTEDGRHTVTLRMPDRV